MKMTKKKVFFISLAMTIICFSIGSFEMLVFWCGEGHLRCQDNLYFFSPYLVLFLPILLFSIITYFLKEEVFKYWLKFTYCYFPIYILGILFLSDMGGGGGFLIGDVFDPTFFAFFLSGLFVVVSLILVVYKAVFLKSSKK